ncbi:MAG TPA: right-handed parallel beta-helix repeat-containing protein [Ktedonobacteraceae bacterium]|nr:right-handed parallel beta-helix repeat-containing protein [Ktedonobacteraceae bacterium]
MNSTTIYAEAVYPGGPNTICPVDQHPNGKSNGDILTNVTSHEQFEATTDPLVTNGWRDSAGLEIGDKCEGNFSAGTTKLKHGGVFEVQEEFSDATSSCVNTFTPHLTVNTTADYSPPCAIAAYSLRCAINQVNSDGSGKPIWFNIPSSDSNCNLNNVQGQNVYVCTITPTSSLPGLTASNIAINGYTQAGSQKNTLPFGSGDNAILTIQIDGSNGVGGLVLTGNATNDSLSGLEITDFSSYGILLFPNTVTGNHITGNFIGTDGINAFGNGTGIYIASGASSNKVGGLGTPASVNLISGNAGQGVVIGAGTGNVIQGNYIGTDDTGQAALHANKGRHISPPLKNDGLPNGIGIALFAGASNNKIGSPNPAFSNIISYNTYGITSEGGSNTSIIGNTVSFNSIGVSVDSNETGDSITQNIIIDNADAGVLVGNSNTDSSHVYILANSIYGNGGLGIDLYPNDVVNCSGPVPGAPNDYTPCPVIGTATQTQISGTACAGCYIEVYIASNEGDDQGHGEGEVFVNSTTADSGGNWSVSANLSSGTWVTATATTPSSPGPEETSEFAANVLIGGNGTGGNLWVTGHDADYHCATDGEQCNYLQVAVNFVTNGSSLPILALDHGSLVPTAISDAFGGNGPTVITIDPRSQFAGLPLVDQNGQPLYSAIVVASDITCGGCDNNNGFGDTPDSDAINARAADIQAFFNAGGGILALAGADNISVFYNFLPIQAVGASTTPPYTFTSLGLSLGLIEGSDDNCCETHNSFELPGSGNPFQVAEVDSAGLAETMIVENGTGMQWKRPTRASQSPNAPRNPGR